MCCAELAGLPAEVATVTPLMLRAAGLFDADLREAREVIAQFDRPSVTDGGAFERTFGPLRPTSHREALAATLAAARASTTGARPGGLNRRRAAGPGSPVGVRR